MTDQTFVWYPASVNRSGAGQTRHRILEFVRQRISEGEPPTLREIRDAMGLRALETVREHLKALENDGLVLRRQGKARGLALPESPSPLRSVPVLGDVAAGNWTEALENRRGNLRVSSRYPAEELFALEVRGHSMRDAAILDGDLLLVRRQPDAETGQIVVAMVEGEATVKRLVKRPGRVELHPANPDFEILHPAAETLEVLGKVLEVRRALEGGLVEEP